LPLRVIKGQLGAGGQDHPERPAGRYPGPAPLTRRELLEATGLDEARLPEAGGFGPGAGRRGGGRPGAQGGRYGPEALAAARAIVALDGYGVQARHLRVLRASAERETALIEQVVAPILRQRSDGARGRATRSAREIAAVTLQLHAALVEATLADAGFGEPRPGQTDG